MKAPPCSWRTGTNSIEEERSSASLRSSVSSPGMPNTWRTPSFSRHLTKTSPAVSIAPAVYRWRPCGRAVARLSEAALADLEALVGGGTGQDLLLGVQLGVEQRVERLPP